ncbi:unnamed protein product, partial [Rotaria sp. Silwood1]
MPSVQDIEH